MRSWPSFPLTKSLQFLVDFHRALFVITFSRQWRQRHRGRYWEQDSPSKYLQPQQQLFNNVRTNQQRRHFASEQPRKWWQLERIVDPKTGYVDLLSLLKKSHHWRNLVSVGELKNVEHPGVGETLKSTLFANVRAPTTTEKKLRAKAGHKHMLQAHAERATVSSISKHIWFYDFRWGCTILHRTFRKGSCFLCSLPFMFSFVRFGDLKTRFCLLTRACLFTGPARSVFAWERLIVSTYEYICAKRYLDIWK